MLSKIKNRLPKRLLEKAIKSNREYGWKQNDFLDVVNTAKEIPMAIVGGQIQYVFPDGICELYWLNYEPKDRKKNEDWLHYCYRTASECIAQFEHVISTKDVEKNAVDNFHFLNDKIKQGIDIDKHKIFVVYFDDSETEFYNKMIQRPKSSM